MTTANLDEKLAETLEAATERVAIRNRDGQIVGYYEPTRVAPSGVARELSPFTDDELREFRKQKEGSLPLAEVLRRLGAE